MGSCGILRMEVDTSAPATDPVAGEERCNSPLEKLVLEDENQEELDKIKVQTRSSDAMYLRQHPELSLLVNRFLQAVFEDSPNDPLSFAQDYFTQKNLEKHILGIDGDDGSSSSGEEDSLVDLDKERAKKRTQVKQELQAKRRQRLRRQKKAKADKACIDWSIDSSTDDDEGDQSTGHNYGLSDARTMKLLDLFSLTDRDHSGSIDCYELQMFTKAFLSVVTDPVLREDSKAIVEQIDIEHNGRVDKDEFLNFFSLVSGAMDDDTFDQVIQELFETLKGVVKVNVDPDMVTGDKMLQLKMLFQGWDSQGTGQVPRDTLYLLAQACQQAGMDVDVGEISESVPDTVTLAQYFEVCTRLKLQRLDSDQFDQILGPLLEQRYN